MTKKKWAWELKVLLEGIMEMESEHFNQCLDDGEFEDIFEDLKRKNVFIKAVDEKIDYEIEHNGNSDYETFLEGIALSFPELVHDYALACRIYHNMGKFIKGEK